MTNPREIPFGVEIYVLICITQKISRCPHLCRLSSSLPAIEVVVTSPKPTVVKVSNAHHLVQL